jgi:NADPH-dependent curcumin reductase CurA
VKASKAAGFAAGDVVSGMLPWSSHAVLDEAAQVGAALCCELQALHIFVVLQVKAAAADDCCQLPDGAATRGGATAMLPAAFATCKECCGSWVQPCCAMCRRQRCRMR